METIQALKEMGIRKTVMLTGDLKRVGEEIGTALGLDEVYTELLPQDKVSVFEKLKKETSGKIVFVGDGINDAPVLAQADIGISMGSLGSDAAIEASDVVLMTDEPMRIVTALKVARRTRSIVWQNIVFALGVKGIFLLLGALGVASMWEAVFADVGVTGHRGPQCHESHENGTLIRKNLLSVRTIRKQVLLFFYCILFDNVFEAAWQVL